MRRPEDLGSAFYGEGLRGDRYLENAILISGSREDAVFSNMTRRKDSKIYESFTGGEGSTLSDAWCSWEVSR